MEDVACGLVCLLVGLGALRMAATPWSRRMVLVSAHVAAVAILIFLLGNLKLFAAYGEFLRADLLPLGLGSRLVPHAVVLSAIGLSVRLALILVPTISLFVHWVGLRAFPSFWQTAGRRLCRPVPIALLAVGLFRLAPTLQRTTGLKDSDFGRNPHLLFLISLLQQPIDFADGARPGWKEPTPGRPLHAAQLLANPPKNLIIIVAECVNARHIETYGCPLPTTPNLRRLAPMSLTFDRFYAASNYSLGTAMPIFAGIVGDPRVLSTFTLFPDLPLPYVSKHLQRLGYRTYLFAAGGKKQWEHYMGFTSHFGTQGFDVARDPSNAFWQESARPDAFLSSDYSDVPMFADARRALRESGSKRFAIFLWTFDAHFPYNPQGPGPDSWTRDALPGEVRLSPPRKREYLAYLRSVWRLDWLVGSLYDELVSLGIAEDTLIVLTGDHGESFGEHGMNFHIQALYDDQVRVPLVFINPRLAALGTRNTTLGGHVDLWATITDVCSLPFEPRWQGQSLIRRSADPRHAFFYSGRLDYYGMREDRWKYFFNRRQGEHFLFDLAADPGEMNNLAANFPGRCEEMSRLVNAWVKYQHRFVEKSSLSDVK
jgi:arylsulfatase A-like enzyme